MTEQFRPQTQPESPNQLDPEGGVAGPLGKSPPAGPEQQPKGEGSKRPESQSIPSVWDALERRVKVQERYSSLGQFSGRRVRKKLYRDDLEVREAEETIRENGTPRDKHILDLFYRTQPSLAPSREGFQEFRARVEQLSDEELAMEIRTRLEAIQDRANQHPGFSPGVGLLEFLKRKKEKP